MQKATALMMLGDKVSAQDAEKMGMIYKYFPADVFENEVINCATTLANMPTLAIGLTKKLVNQSLTNNLEEQLKMESDLQIQASSSHDYNEGVSAFVEKRKPIFLGK
jgi:2-(1,2-epoxy-1,2-dihydrophenyl)acetyl-CoA isomerase